MAKSKKKSDVESPAELLDMDPEDVKRVQDAVAEAGLSACGIMGIDVWMMNEEDEKLYHFGQQGLNWVNPVFKRQLEDGGGRELRGYDYKKQQERLEELHRLTDRENPKYYHTLPEPSGVGLAGNYWQQFGDLAESASNFNDPLVWRRVKAFTSDPDQMPVKRVFALERVFGKCTGVPFNIFEKYRGVVVLFARETAEENIINSEENSHFIRLASYNIACTLATSFGKVESLKYRMELSRRSFRTAKIAVVTVGAMKTNNSGGDSREEFRDEEGKKSLKNSLSPLNSSRKKSFGEMLAAFKDNLISAKDFLKTKAKMVKNKSIKPPDLEPPSPANIITSLWSFIGSFAMLTAMFGIDNFFREITDGQHALLLPPFGALAALQFSLTAAPSTQPRNCFLGFCLAFIMSMLNKILMHHTLGLPRWFHSSLGASFAVFSMHKTGLIHPPAAAAAFVIALSTKDVKADLIAIGIFLCAVVISIALAIFINNMSDTRQYPMYWRMKPSFEYLKRDSRKSK